MGWFGEVIAWFSVGENWTGSNGVLPRLVQHVALTAAAMLVSCAIALPLGLWIGHTNRGAAVAINVSNIGRAIPTFAVLVLLVIGPFGVGTLATLVALVLFAVPPILTNTYVGMRGVDRDVVEAGQGMGLSGSQLLRRVELPLAVPLIMTGVRLATVQVVATATIAAIVAGPGLGRIITQGFGLQDQAQVVAGAICVAVLALVVEGLLLVAQRWVDPLHGTRASASGLRGAEVPG
jgi:osmoprotectant transport system permease protein